MPCVSMRLFKTQLYKKKEHKRGEEEEEEAHGGEAVDGMETAAQREATWNGTVHSFDSQVLALRKRKKKDKKRNGRGKKNVRTEPSSVFFW